MKRILMLFLALLVGCTKGGNSMNTENNVLNTGLQIGKNTDISTADPHNSIVLAGGCFWGTDEYMQRLPGVVRTFSAYANGEFLDPSYEEVCSGRTGHAEAVFVEYDPNVIDLEHLLEQFFLTINPLQKNRQGNDRGSQYRSGIYYLDETDLPIIEKAVQKVESEYGKKIETEVKPLANLSIAQEYHQDYLQKNPNGYCHVSFDTLPKEGDVLTNKKDNNPFFDYEKKDKETLKKELTPDQWKVTQESGTERPFTGEYDKFSDEGIYVDITTGQPLFSSDDKFDAGCGWPSFTKPIDDSVIEDKEDNSHGMIRTEVRSALGDAHLGHVFPDGPKDKGGLRYCINSASLRFIPKDKMEEEGYGYLLERKE